MGASEWISIVGIIVSAGFAGWSAWSARESKRAEGRADAQVTALVGIADALKRHADGVEIKLQQQKETVSAEERAPWRIVRVSRGRWDLINLTTTPKYAVRITGPAILQQHEKHVKAMLPGRGSMQIRGAFRSMQTADDLEITWHRHEDLSDEQLSWPGQLPKE
jgi:hypothetical protein